MEDPQNGWTSFESFVATRLTALYRYAMVLTGDRHDAEDLVQEALTRTGVRWRRVVRVSGGTVVGMDPWSRPWAAKGCAKGATVGGEADEPVAFSYPDVFVVDPHKADGLRQIDVDSGSVVAERPLPEGVGVRPAGAQRWQLWLAAANRDTFAWVVDSVLRTADRATWQVTEARRGLPTATELNWGGRMESTGEKIDMHPHLYGSLTMGNRLIAYSAVDLVAETGWRSVVYDPRSGQSFELRGLVYAAGDWLVWPDGASYRLARVR
ncbi:hypothetical protein ABT294_06935 [Nonomuraea sp. NPDC000554]|uniref:hypothetical protein n=1 Tax=Nonomuraea sp. NPDC000554 TaxID=3154259 RepID=UPI00331F03F8